VVELNEAEPLGVSRFGLVTLGIFIALVVALAVLVALTPGDMAGIGMMFIAVPWIVFALLLGPGGFEFGFIVGFLINLILAYAVGAFIERWWRRRQGRTAAT
jgi:hypothetical protein